MVGRRDTGHRGEGGVRHGSRIFSIATRLCVLLLSPQRPPISAFSFSLDLQGTLDFRSQRTFDQHRGCLKMELALTAAPTAEGIDRRSS